MEKHELIPTLVEGVSMPRPNRDLREISRRIANGCDIRTIQQQVHWSNLPYKSRAILGHALDILAERQAV